MTNHDLVEQVLDLGETVVKHSLFMMKQLEINKLIQEAFRVQSERVTALEDMLAALVAQSIIEGPK